jgi:hypothetical protein
MGHKCFTHCLYGSSLYRQCKATHFLFDLKLEQGLACLAGQPRGLERSRCLGQHGWHTADNLSSRYACGASATAASDWHSEPCVLLSFCRASHRASPDSMLALRVAPEWEDGLPRQIDLSRLSQRPARILLAGVPIATFSLPPTRRCSTAAGASPWGETRVATWP